MIPKIMHFYWGRNIPLSFLRYLSVYSFAKFNPEWEINVWYNANPCLEITWKTNEQKTNIYYGEDYFDRLKTIPKVNLITFDFDTLNLPKDIPEVIKSDILRLHLIYTYGGFFSGIDILYVRPLEQWPKLMEALHTANVVLCYRKRKGGKKGQGLRKEGGKSCLWFPYICFFGGVYNETVFKGLLSLAYKRMDVTSYQAVGVHLFNEYFNYQYAPDIYPPKYIADVADTSIYPLSGSQYHMYFQQYFCNTVTELCRNAIGLHWFGGGKGKQDFENRVTDKTLKYNRHIPIFSEAYKIFK